MKKQRAISGVTLPEWYRQAIECRNSDGFDSVQSNRSDGTAIEFVTIC
jgi:hypothetical protein